MSVNSSFDPLDYYQKLTLCLANKKNCKVNLSRLPGGKIIKENKKLPTRITNKNLQAKFLANYNLQKCQQQQQQLNGQHQQDRNNSENILKPANPLNFNLKAAATNENGKRKKDFDNNLVIPVDYFKSANVPDLSIFKVPAVPPPSKKPRIQETSVSAEDHSRTNNFTLDSLFSGNFRPPIASTPNKTPKPIICDPTEILKSIEESRVRSLKAFDKSRKAIAGEKRKSFNQLIEDATLQIDSSYYSDMADPTLEILNRLHSVYKIASQEPRKSLLDENSPSHLESLISSTSSRPIPEFFENENEEENKSNIFNETVQSGAIFNQTFATISIFEKSSKLAGDNELDSSFDFFKTPAESSASINNSSFNLFTTPARSTLGTSASVNDSFAESDCNVRENMSFNWLDDVFNSPLELTFDDTLAKNNDFIFRSPPQRSSRSALSRKFSQLEIKKSSSGDFEETFWNAAPEQPTPFQMKDHDNIFDMSCFDLF